MQFDSNLFFHTICDDLSINDKTIETVIKGLNGIDFKQLPENWYEKLKGPENVILWMKEKFKIK